jgi:hypothetical protein
MKTLCRGSRSHFVATVRLGYKADDSGGVIHPPAPLFMSGARERIYPLRKGCERAPGWVTSPPTPFSI